MLSDRKWLQSYFIYIMMYSTLPQRSSHFENIVCVMDFKIWAEYKKFQMIPPPMNESIIMM